MTKADLITLLARRKTEALLAGIVWADIVVAVQAMSVEEKQSIVDAIRRRQNTVGVLIIDAVLRKLATDGITAVTQALADDTLTIAELQALVP